MMEREVSALTPSGFTGREFVMGSGSCWITIGSISVYIINTGEGVAVELLPTGDEMAESLGETWATFPDKEQEATGRSASYHGAGYCFSCKSLTSDRILGRWGTDVSAPLCIDCYSRYDQSDLNDPDQLSLEL